MRRVYALWLLKRVFSHAGTRALALAAVLFGVFTHVSVFQVLANAPVWTDLPGNAYFFSQAFLHTEFIVQITFALLLFSTTLVLFDFTARRVSSIALFGWLRATLAPAFARARN